MRYVIKQAENPEHSIVVPFTRVWCVEKFFNRLNQLEIPQNSEIIFWVDTSEEKLYLEVSKKAERLQGFVGVVVIWARNGEYVGDSVGDCRRRIINLHEELKSEIMGNIVIGLEDDTLPPVDALTRLVEHLESPQVGFVQGVEVGRRGYRVFGAWKFDGEVVTTLPKGKGLEEVDGGGFYCFATLARLYKAHIFDQRNSDTGFLGPDFNFVWGIRCKGYKCLTDWDLPCVHITEERDITVDDAHHIASWERDGNGWRSKLIVL